MTEVLWVTALLSGLLGGAHCLGMCGGIAGALAASAARAARSWHVLLHAAGRLAGYVSAGAAAVTLGRGAGWALGAQPNGAILRLVAAGVIVIIGLSIATAGTRGGRWLRGPERWGAGPWRRLSRLALRWLPANATARALGLGLLWGWLPCGLVYSTLLLAAASGGSVAGAGTMLAFGAGTLPVTLGLGWGAGVWARLRTGGARWVGAAVIAGGVWSALLPLAGLMGLHQHGP